MEYGDPALGPVDPELFKRIPGYQVVGEKVDSVRWIENTGFRYPQDGPIDRFDGEVSYADYSMYNPVRWE